MPQLCTLLVVRDEDLSKQLECFILHKCMKSIDFAIKCFWNLHAQQFYSKFDAQRDRCDELRQNLEMIVVNGQLPRSLLMQIPKDVQQEIIRQQTEKPNRSPHSKSILIEDEEKYNNNNHNNNNNNSKQNGHIQSNDNNNNLPASNGNHINGNSQNSNTQNGKHSMKPSKAAPLLSSALPKPKKPDNLKENDPLLNGAAEYLKKQRRCTYFNAELDFAHFLEGVSSALGMYHQYN